MPEEIRLRVGELTAREEAGRGLVRIDFTTMQKLGVREGDVIEVEGTRKTAAIAVRAYPADVGLNLIRMDGILRKNAGAGVGEYVTVRKPEVREARSVTLAPAEPGVTVRVSPSLVKKNLLLRPVVKGDIIVPSPVARRPERGTWIEEFFGPDIFEMFFPTFPAETRFMVTHTEPAGVVRIGDITEVKILPRLPPTLKVEAKAIPRVTYEDIGGLKGAIAKVREMVELPLRHPELFRRLGIEPPKGVLLYGPPGCGKCVAPDTPVIVNDEIKSIESVFQEALKSGKVVKRDEKSWIIRPGKRLRIKSLNPVSLRVEDREVLFCYREKAPAKLYLIRTRTGKEIVVTGEHPFFKMMNGIKKVKAMNLREGEFIATPRKLELKGLGLAMFQGSLYPQGTDAELIIENGSLLRLRPSKNWKLPKAIKPVGPCKELAEFLAFIASEGSKPSSGYAFHSSDGSKLRRFTQLSKDLFGLRVKALPDTSDGTFRINLYSKTLERFLEGIGFKKLRASQVKLPSWLLREGFLRTFLRVYFDCDGFVSDPSKREAARIEILTKSRDVANFLALVFLSLELVPKIYKKVVKGSTYYRVSICGIEDVKRFAELIGSSDRSKLRRLNEWLRSGRKSWTGADIIPNCNQLLERIRKSMGLGREEFYLSKKGRLLAENEMRITRNRLQKIAKKTGSKLLERLSSSDLFWDRIVKIEEIDSREHGIDYVYDLTVPGSHNFIAGFGWMIVHNTLLAKAVANEAGAYFISIAGPEVMSKWYGESEKRIREVFEEAEKNAPAIIFFDEIDAIAPKREMVTGEVERRVVSQLLSCMDGLRERGKVIVIAATNLPQVLDPALRRPGRFDREIEIPVPDRNGRLEILKIHTRHMPLAKDVNLEKLADITYGFSGADLASLCKEAAMLALRRVLPTVKWKEEEELPKEVLEKLVVKMKDFRDALKFVEPSAMREVLVEVPKVRWEDIGGLEEVKQALREMIEWPLKHPESFKRLGISPPRGILLYGPPGCGKSLLAKAVANEAGANFIAIRGPEVYTLWVGESERKVREIFRRAKQVAPCIVLFDEFDALAPRRGLAIGTRVTETVVSQLLTELSGIEELKGIVVIATTNRPDIIDPALLRPGRIDKLVLVPAPDERARLEIFKVHTKDMPLKGVDLEELARRTEGYSGADIEAICREAAMNALRKDIKAKHVTMKHFEEAFKRVGPSITKEMIEFYNKFLERHKARVREKEAERPPSYYG